MRSSQFSPKKTPNNIGSVISPNLIHSWVKMLLKFKKGAKAKPKLNSKLTPDMMTPPPREENARISQPSELEIKKILNFSFKDVQALWESYNKGDKNSRRLFHDPNRERQAYLCGFHLSNTAKFSLFLQRLDLERPEVYKRLTKPNEPKDAKLRILDIGCGSGAFSQALVEKSCSNFSNIEVVLIDKSKQFLEVAEFGIESLALTSNFIIQKKIVDVTKPEFTKFLSQLLRESNSTAEKTILLFGNIWNEIMVQSGEAALDQFVQKLFEDIQKLKYDVEILVSEPVHKGFAKKMMEIRESLVNVGINCFYPCPTVAQTCPLLARKQFKDYCYSDFKWEMPIYFKKYSENLDLDRSYLSSSMYYFSNSSSRTKKQSEQHPMHVLVGKPIEKDAIKMLQCTPKGTHSTRTEKFSPQSTKLRGQII